MAMKPKAPMPKATPADDEDESAAGDSGAMSGEDSDDDAGAEDDNDEEAGDDESGDVTLVTICKAPGGGYIVYAGDEPEEGESGEEEEGSEAGEGDEEAAGDEGEEGGNGEGANEPEGKPAESIGAALKAAMDILKDDEAKSSGEGSEADNFNAGFAGGSSVSPPRPGLEQKY